MAIAKNPTLGEIATFYKLTASLCERADDNVAGARDPVKVGGSCQQKLCKSPTMAFSRIQTAQQLHPLMRTFVVSPKNTIGIVHVKTCIVSIDNLIL